METKNINMVNDLGFSSSEKRGETPNSLYVLIFSINPSCTYNVAYSDVTQKYS